MAYFCKHIVKDIVHRGKAPTKTPEFHKWSTNPGIGGFAAKEIGDYLLTKEGSKYIVNSNGDVPGTIRIGKEIWSLDNYMRNRIREYVGLPKGATEFHKTRLDEFYTAILMNNLRDKYFQDIEEQMRVSAQVAQNKWKRQQIKKVKKL